MLSGLTPNGIPASVPMTEPFLSGRFYEQTPEGTTGRSWSHRRG
jgi:hypothetical protein